MTTSGFIYLASPFWHDAERVRLQRYARTRLKTAELLLAGFRVFSPIVHSFHIHLLLHEGIRHSHDFWLQIDLAILRSADEMWVLKLDGWGESKGIKIETDFAARLSIPVRYLEEEENAPTETRQHPDLPQPAAEGLPSGGPAGAG